MTDKKLSILLVDDNPDDLSMIKANILSYSTRQRYDIIEYDNPHTALTWLTNEDKEFPDCMILDLHMPQMTGLEFLKTLRDAHGGLLPLPVILLTGSTFDQEDDLSLAKQTLQLGAQDYITKNGIRPEWLMRTVHNAIERYHLVQQLRNIDEQHRLATEAVNLGTWSYKKESKHFICSSRCQDILRLNGNREWVFEDFFTHIHSDDVARVQERLQGVLDEPQDHDFHLEYRILLDDGQVRWVNVAGRAYETPDGDVHMRGIIGDITDRKLSEEKLIESEQFARSILNSSPDCIKVIDIEGRLLDMNDSGMKQMQIDDFSVCQNLPWYSLWPADERHKAIEALHLARQGKTSWFEGFCPTAKQTPKWWEVIVTPIMDGAGEPEKILSMSRDITERKIIQDKLQDALVEAQTARRRAEEASQAKSEFLANMSHEIRTPMNAVIGLANILAISDPLTPKQREFIHTLQISADSLLALINDLLDIAKIEARSVDIEHVPFNLSNLMQEIVSVMSLRAREKNLSFTVDDTMVQNRTYYGDPTRLKQVVTNLCSNALKFTHTGGVTISLTRTELPQDDKRQDEICIAVNDTGIGIPTNKVNAIFEKFVQADSSINRKYGGTGLGLAITKTLIEAMGGRIRVNSVVNQGSSFKIFIPLACDMEPAEEPSTSLTSETANDTSSDTRPFILLVEDYPANVLVATMYLEEFGYRYEVANNGMEAVEKAKAKHFDAIIMDVQMPGMNGFEATKAIRTYADQNNIAPIPIIGMTAHALAGDRERCLEAGMTDYITKPFNPDDLQQKLAQAVGHV